MARDLGATKLADYKPTEIIVDCRRCRRHALLNTFSLRAKHDDRTLGDLARIVAAGGQPPCALAADAQGKNFCNAIPVEPPVESWARLEDALWGGWTCALYCERRHASLKVTKSCPGPMKLDVRSLVAALGHDFKLERLPTRCRCPGCGGEALSIRWHVPDPPGAAKPVALFDEVHFARIAKEASRRLKVVKTKS